MGVVSDLKKYQVRGEEVEFSEIYYNNLMDLKKLVDNNFDAVEVDDGMEGSGKSELAKQKALLLNNDFCEDDIVYTVDQFNEWVSQAKPGSVCLWDEFVLAGLSSDALTKMQNTLIKQFAIMRSKRLIVILVIPFFFMLRKYFAVARTRYLSHTYTQGMKRGFVKVYNYKTKHYLYNYGQKTWLYNPKIIPSFEVRFTAWSHKFLDEEKIEAKKQAALQSLNEDDLILTKREKELLPLMLTNPFTQKTNNNDYKLAHNFIKKVKHYWKYRDNPSDIPPQES